MRAVAFADDFERRFLSADVNGADPGEQTEGLQEPKNHANYDNDIKDIFYLPIHGNVVVDEPKKYANDDQNND